MTSRQDYLTKFKAQLDELNASVTEYEAKAQKAESEAKILYMDNLFKLRQQLTAAHDKLNEMQVATESNWDHFVAETERVRDVFLESFHHFKSHI